MFEFFFVMKKSFFKHMKSTLKNSKDFYIIFYTEIFTLLIKKKLSFLNKYYL